jgi:uncharacterized membrane protein
MPHLVDAWASMYSNHAALRTGIDFVHVAGLLVGGGCAVAADRMTLRAAGREPALRTIAVQSLADIHRVVLAGLAAVIASGVLQFFADLDTFLYSRIFWIKMGLVVLLLANGLVLVRAERQAERGEARGWPRLRTASAISLGLWLVTTLAGAALPNI